MTELASHLGVFLRQHLPRDRNASHHTVLSYADSFQLLVCFTAERLGVRPCRIEIEQLTAPLILDFLDNLERERNNTVGTRNVRLAAFKSFFRYLAYRAPACLDLAHQVHAIPMKRRDEALVESLNRDELRALLDAPDPTTAAGVRDRAMLHLTYAAGLRVLELIGLMCADLALPHLDTVRVTGKGRRERVLPLWQETRSALRDWLAVRPVTGHDHLFLNARGKGMTRHGFAHRLALHAATARQTMPSMASKRIFPHLLRHSCAAHTGAPGPAGFPAAVSSKGSWSVRNGQCCCAMRIRATSPGSGSNRMSASSGTMPCLTVVSAAVPRARGRRYCRVWPSAACAAGEWRCATTLVKGVKCPTTCAAMKVSRPRAPGVKRYPAPPSTGRSASCWWN